MPAALSSCTVPGIVTSKPTSLSPSTSVTDLQELNRLLGVRFGPLMQIRPSRFLCPPGGSLYHRHRDLPEEIADHPRPQFPLVPPALPLCVDRQSPYEKRAVNSIHALRETVTENEIGRSRARTCDLSDVTRTLSQLSYSPKVLANLLATLIDSSEGPTANQALNSAFSSIPARLSPSRFRVISTNPSSVTSMKSAETRSFFSSVLSCSTTCCTVL